MCCLSGDTLGEALLAAYTEYLERVFLSSDELACVAEETVPEDTNLALLEEWAYLA